MDGICGASGAPSNCPDCGEPWSAGERLKTNDDARIGGYEDWMYCKNCKCELFYPTINRPEQNLKQKEKEMQPPSSQIAPFPEPTPEIVKSMANQVRIVAAENKRKLKAAKCLKS